MTKRRKNVAVKRAPQKAPSKKVRGRKNLKRWLVAAIFVALVGIWTFTSFYAIQKFTGQWQFQGMSVLIVAPRYISANDEDEVRFAVTNYKDMEARVEFRLLNSPSLPSLLCSDLQNFKNILYAGMVGSKEQINQRCKILFPWDTSQPDTVLGHVAELSLWGGGSQTALQKISDLPIAISPLPWNRSISVGLGPLLAGAVIYLGKQMWDQSKEGKKKK